MKLTDLYILSEALDAETRHNRRIMLKKLRELSWYSPWNADHCVHVAKLARDFAKYLGLDPKDITNVALSHDVGKAQTPHKVLHKPDKLTPEERTVMDKHAPIGYEQLSKMTGEYGKLARLGALHHHRTPNELKELQNKKELTSTEVNLIKILTIVDIFDALIDTGRPYKSGKTKKAALDIMESDPHIDAALFKKFKQWQLSHFTNEYR